MKCMDMYNTQEKGARTNAARYLREIANCSLHDVQNLRVVAGDGYLLRSRAVMRAAIMQIISA
jgi:hypothetical protein